MSSHASQNLENLEIQPLAVPCYLLIRTLPKTLFYKNYPSNPTNFGERLRKARMDAGMQIKDLARILEVTPDTVINWEMRGRIPMKRNIRDNLKKFINH
jgi:DNA-binding XRE family transcriptional regulator